MEVIHAHADEFAGRGAAIIRDALCNTLSHKPHAVLGLCGGRSVSGIFTELCAADVDWGRVHVFLADERMVGPDHVESNYGLAYRSFLNSLVLHRNMPKANLHPFRVDEGVQKYSMELMGLGGRIDVILLSSGEDGHVGALYPRHHSVHDTGRGYIEMHDSPKPPPRRVTVSRSLLLKSGFALLLFFGEQKMGAYRMFTDKNVSYANCPAKLVQRIRRSVVLVSP